MKRKYIEYETLYHHLKEGIVWAGDQISKETTIKLAEEGLLDYSRADGCLTQAGRDEIINAFIMFRLWTWARKLKWKIKEFPRKVLAAVEEVGK